MNRHLRYVGAVAGVGAIYWLAAKAGLQLAYLHGSVAALWPPVGVGMAVLILYGTRLWPGIVVGDLAVADFSQPIGTVLGQTIGNTLEVVIAALLFYRLAEGRTHLARVRDVGALVAAAAAGTAISATFGAASLRLGDVITSGEVREVWRTWFLGDFSGALVFAPLVLCWVGVRVSAITRRQALEGSVVTALMVVLALLPSQRRRAVHRVSGPDLGGASRRPTGSIGRGGAGHDAHGFQYRTPRRPVRARHDHSKPACHTAVRSCSGADVAGPGRGHRGAPRRSRGSAREGATAS